MNSTEIFSLALGLGKPWFVKDIKLEIGEGKSHGQMDIYLDFERGFKFKDIDGKELDTHDTVSRTWQHLNFFQHMCFLHARVPRVETGDGKVVNVQVPWARPGSGFTLLFEAFSMLLIESEMPVSAAANIVNVYPQRIWNIFNHWVNKAYLADNQSGITRLGIDETSVKKGHNYVTVGVDMDCKRVIFATPGKDAGCISQLKDHLVQKGTAPESIQQVSIDMSVSFISGVGDSFPDAAITFDRFHVVKVMTIKTHWSGIVNYAQSKLTNGILEGINSKIQLAQKRARGYRNIHNFINIIYIIAGKLKFDYPLYSI